MNSNAEQISDEDLASTISDDGRLSSEVREPSDQGLVEAGIPPEIKDSSTNADLEEEPFSVNDFDEDIEGANPVLTESESLPDQSEESAIPQAVSSASSFDLDKSENESLPAGQVSEFRKTLSALSRQLEVDRLTFLYQKLHADGNELPSLDKIASDIRGDSTLHPMGDHDLYSKRPLARLQGWISGLSFGVGRRAKKFSR
jgi:hypothetical protein